MPIKKNHHADGLNPGIMPHFPSKMFAVGRSGSGKGSTIKNLLLTAVPPYDAIVLLHYAPESTLEWDDVEPTKKLTIDEFPTDPSDLFDRTKKNAIVCDELSFEGMTRANKGKLDRCVNFSCSHFSCTLFMIQQNFFSIPPSIRRAADWLIIWPSVDQNSMDYISRLTGHDMRQLKRLCQTKYDSIALDFSGDGPAVRSNLFTPIEDVDA